MYKKQKIVKYNFFQAVLIDRTLYISGQLGMDPNTMEIVEGGVVEEAIQALKNMHMILKRAQSDFTDVVKTTILLKSIKDFQAVNEIYSQCFTTDMPARAAFEVSSKKQGNQARLVLSQDSFGIINDYVKIHQLYHVKIHQC